jgi:hypothetical protein
MPATRRKPAAATINVPAVPRRFFLNPRLDDRSRERRASLVAPDRSEKMSNPDIAIREGRSQPRRVQDICKLRNSIATSPPSIPTLTSIEVSTITAVVVGIVDIAPDMRRVMTAAVVVGIITVDRAWTYRQGNSYAVATRFDRNHMIPAALAGLHIEPPIRVGSIGHWRNAEETDRQHASRQHGCE